MKILILGGGGLIGHKLFSFLTKRFTDVYCTLHGTRTHEIFDSARVFESIDVLDQSSLCGVIQKVSPDIILNCVGVTKRKPEIADMEYAIQVNSVFPHTLAKWADEISARVIHFSTDCVFDGTIGNYSETSPTSATDTYGKTKALGEINYNHTLTIRSSFIGREITGKSELLEWCIGSRGETVNGFSEAYYSGISTITMAGIVGDIIEFFPGIGGLRQLAAVEPISKYQLVQLANEKFQLSMTVKPNSDFVIKPTLDGARLRREIELQLPDWPTMMEELASESESKFYD